MQQAKIIQHNKVLEEAKKEIQEQEQKKKTD